MSKPSGLIVFESADEVMVSMLGSTPTLSASGFYCELCNSYSGLSLSSGIEEKAHAAFDRPLAYVQSGGALHGTKQVWFTTRDAADVLIARVQAQYINDKQKKQRGLTANDATDVKAQLRAWIGTCLTAVVICFLGAGAANFGWKTFDPLAVQFAGTHAPNEATQAKAMQSIWKPVGGSEQALSEAILAYGHVRNQQAALAESSGDPVAFKQAIEARDAARKQMLPEQENLQNQ